MGAVIAISLVNIGIGAFFLFCKVAWGQTGGTAMMDLAFMSPLFIGSAGFAFLRVRRESLENTDVPVWIALGMCAALGAYLLWILHEISRFGTT